MDSMPQPRGRGSSYSLGLNMRHNSGYVPVYVSIVEVRELIYFTYRSFGFIFKME